MENSFLVVFKNLKDCFKFSNEYVLEYLIIVFKKFENYVWFVINVGFVFLGNYSCESVGDYVLGINYMLFINGYVKSYSGVLVDSFYKKIMF